MNARAIITLSYNDVRTSFELTFFLDVFRDMLYLLVFAPAIAYLVNERGFILFISLGLLITAMMSGSFKIAYSLFHEEKSYLQFEYFLSLPVSRKELLLGRMLGGLGLAFMHFLPLFVTVVVLFNLWSVYFIAGSLLIFILLSAAFVGIFLCLIVIIGDYYLFNIVSVNGMQVMRKLSTVFYPLSVFPWFLSPFVLLNPVSLGAALIRALEQNSLHLAGWLILLVFGTGSIVTGMLIYEKKLERSSIH